VEIRVLGPVELVGVEGPVRLAAMPRRLLAALVTDRGETRNVDVLVEALWPERPPREAPKVLQLYVSRLRKALPQGARIRTDGSGYALELDEEVLDAASFERLLNEARAVADEGNSLLAASLLHRALSLWRGQAFGELAYEDFARAEAERLDELRLAALEERFEAELALGRAAEMLPELSSAAAAHPLRERLQGQMMLALYRLRRQTEALEVYARLRARLDEELGLEPSAELRELQRQILQQDPSLGAVSADQQQPTPPLPAPPNPLLGRERELEELHGLLVRDRVRLLVLTGAGGSGKTRLAIDAAREASPSFANGAAFVALAPLRDPALVLPAISEAIGLSEQARGEFEAVAAALRPRELLLVLDNAEHLRDAAPTYVELLAKAPRLTLLVTSRVVLHLSGEQLYPVEPLRNEAAVSLFLERAREGDAHFHPTRADVETIERICATLDRLPLAIELAAARVRTLTPGELLARLEPCLPLLTGGARDLPARQQTLRATLNWSVDLLEEEERRDLCRLSVFVGGWTLEAAEAVCNTSLDRLSSLVDQNLVQRAISAGASRYWMLETIREYALERLEETGEAEEIRRRHATHYLGDPLDAERIWLPNEEPDLLGRLDRELANVRGALDWAHRAQSPLELDLATLYQRGDAVLPSEGRQRLEAALANPTPQRPRLRARALAALGGLAHMAGDLDIARRHSENALRLYRELGDETGERRALWQLAVVAGDRGDQSEEARLFDEFAGRVMRGGDPARPRPLSLEGARAFSAGNREEARKLFEQSLERTAGAGLLEAWAHLSLADLAIVEGRFDDAVRACAATLEIVLRHGRQLEIWGALRASARALAGTNELETAVRLHAAFFAWREARGQEYLSLIYPSFLRELREYEPAALRAATTDPEFARIAAEGRRMTLDEAIDCAREALARVAPRPE
jgi:predicted ATPase/DNA-binding SARP family transcriptional activator